MGSQEQGWGGLPTSPGGAPPYSQMEDHWTHFDNSVNAVSFGFVATAVLISMFLVMAIFEKLLRTTPPGGVRRIMSDVEAQDVFFPKRGCTSPKIYAREFSVVMPGNNVPTFIANPAPVPCPPERMSWPTQTASLYMNSGHLGSRRI